MAFALSCSGGLQLPWSCSFFVEKTNGGAARSARRSAGGVLETALRQGVVAITKRDAPKAVLLGASAYAELARSRRRVARVRVGDSDG